MEAEVQGESNPASEHPVEEIPAATAGKADESQAPGADPWYKDSKIWINLAGYIAVTLTLVMVKMRPELMPAGETGFPCNDLSLNHPFKPESVQQRTLIISTVSILLMSVFISEGVFSISPDYQAQLDQQVGGATEPSLKEKILLFINLVTSKLLYGYLGLIITMSLTIQAQHLSCMYRPDFLVTCNLKTGVCKGAGVIAQIKHCQGPEDKLLDGRMSFPSEYATISFYMSVFSSLIIERAISSDYFALKLAVQTSYISWALYLSCSRMKDHKNHGADVLAGAIFGIIAAFFTDYLATYQEYPDTGLGYDPNNINIDIPQWDEIEPGLEADPQAELGGENYNYA